MQLRFPIAVAVAQASSCSSIRPLAWELPYALDVGLKKTKKIIGLLLRQRPQKGKKIKNKKQTEVPSWLSKNESDQEP